MSLRRIDGPIVLEIPSDPCGLFLVRSLMERLSQRLGFSESMVRQMVLAVDEACTNVIRHAYEKLPGKRIVLTFLIREELLEIQVRDFGKPPDPDALKPIPRYIQAFYWTITTLTTIGYGDITPDGSSQTIFVIIIELLGAGMYGLIIGNIANLIANIDVAKTQYKEKLEKINTFLKYRDIPPQMQRKINEYYNYLWESRRGYDESDVLQDLPMPIIVLRLYRSSILLQRR